MKRLLFIYFIALCFTSNAQFDFYQQDPPSGTSSVNLNDVSFVNDSLGFAIGAVGRIIKTTNGGYTWELASSPTTEWITSVDFESADIGYIGCTNGYVYKTTDGGTTWFDISPSSIFSTDDVNVVEFFNENHGIVAGDYACAYTVDGGSSWNASFAPPGYNNFTDVEFASVDSAMAILADTAIFTTVDGGANWDLVTPAILDFDPQGLEVINSSHYVIVGGYGDVIYSKDMGATWGIASLPFLDYFYDVDFLDNNNGIICGGNRAILHTNDGGENWSNVGPFGTGNLYAVNYISTDVVSIVGGDYIIYRSPAPSDLIIEEYTGVTEGCPGDIVSLDFTIKNDGYVALSDPEFIVSYGSGGSDTYVWSGTLAPGTSATVTIGSVTLSSTDSYSVLIVGDDITDNNNFSFSIDVYSTGALGVSDNDFICLGGTAEIAAYGGLSYVWYNLDNPDADSTSATQYVSPEATKTYYVKIKQDVCTVLDSVLITVGGPNVDCNTSANYSFTPNADGINDFFFLNTLQPGDNKLIVFNRWGNKIKEFDNYDNDQNVWDGTSSGNNRVPTGTYYYTFRNIDSGYEESGWVQVLY